MPKRVRRKRMGGRGFGDFLSNTLGGLGSGLGSGVHNLFGNLFGGKRRPRRTKRRMAGKGVFDLLFPGASLIKKTLFGGRRKRRMRGRGDEKKISDAVDAMAPKSLLQRINQVAKDSKVLSKGLKEFGPEWAATAASTLGYGRKRRVRKMKGGYMGHFRSGNVPIVGMGALHL